MADVSSGSDSYNSSLKLHSYVTMSTQSVFPRVIFIASHPGRWLHQPSGAELPPHRRLLSIRLRESPSFKLVSNAVTVRDHPTPLPR